MEHANRDLLVAQPVGKTMTIGGLSKRTGVPAKQLRRYEDLGFIYTVGRSGGNYRLFDESALWCVGAIETWRSLGLTLAEISELTEAYVMCPEENIGPRLGERLRAVRERTNERILELRRLLRRIDSFEADNGAALAGIEDFRDTDPRFAKHA